MEARPILRAIRRPGGGRSAIALAGRMASLSWHYPKARPRSRIAALALAAGPEFPNETETSEPKANLNEGRKSQPKSAIWRNPRCDTHATRLEKPLDINSLADANR
jgi:hypothetical protein